MKSSYLLLAAAIVMASCKKDKDSADPTYKLEGKLTNTTSRPVRLAKVSLMHLGQTTTAYSATTDTGGRYSVTGVAKGQYLVRFERDGFTSDTDTVNIGSNATVNKLVKGAAQITGTIINSQTGYGLAGARVSLTLATSGSSDTTAALADFVAITDASGNYSMSDVASGSVARVVRASHFTTDVTPVLHVTNGPNDLGRITIVQTLAQGALRIVLTWGEDPSDLDSHLSGPDGSTGGGRFHCYYSNKNPSDSGASLDVDDTDSFGPETTTIPTLRNGTYRFSVHNYSHQSDTGSNNIARSGARVRVYNASGLIREYTPPTPVTPGNTWRVFEADALGNITPINNYQQAAGSGDVGTFRTNGSKPPMLGKEF